MSYARAEMSMGGAELAKTGTKGTEVNGKGNKGSEADPSGKRRGRRSIGGSQDLTHDLQRYSNVTHHKILK